ncbi:hypothetical protein [Providencia phage PSTRCR_121]|nr:hypothetical protein [Providencia phage PSTRCR_121]
MKTFYHGTSTACDIDFMLLPPDASNTLSEKGRKKNLGRVFFTEDLGLARIYAGRTSRSLGGNPIIFKVVSPVDVVCMNSTPGASVYHAAWAFCEKVE